jgi:hypothetical protein
VTDTVFPQEYTKPLAGLMVIPDATVVPVLTSGESVVV